MTLRATYVGERLSDLMPLSHLEVTTRLAVTCDLLGVGRGFSTPTSPLIRASKFSKTHGNLAVIATATSKKNEGILSDDSLLYITKTPVDAGRCLPSNTSRFKVSDAFRLSA